MKLKAGDRVRAKVRTIFGWKGTGVVELVGESGLVDIIKDDTGRRATFLREQVARIREQQP